MYRFKTEFEPFARAFLSCESDSISVKTACGMRLNLMEAPLKLDADLGFAMVPRYWSCSTAFGTGVYCLDWALDSLIARSPDDADDLKYIKENMMPYTCQPMTTKYFDDKLSMMHEKGGVWGGTWIGHAVPQFSDIAKYGTAYFREKIKKYRNVNPQNSDFYKALEILLDGLDAVGERFLNMAEDALCGEVTEKQKRNLEVLKNTFSHAPKAPCENFAEACIICVMLYSIDDVDSPGHFDQYMYEFWEKTDEALRAEYLENIWEYFHSVRAWNLCISGSDENWNDLTNSLSYEILRVAKKFKYQTPNITMRCHRNTPEKLLNAAYESIATGCGMPALYNDEAVCPALEGLGIPSADAHRYVMNGCNQIDIQGKSHMGLEDGEVNVAKAVELTLHNGIDFMHDLDYGVKTGDPCEFDTYEEFYAAYIKQLEHLIDCATEMSNRSQRALSEGMSSPLRSLTIEGCIEKGLEYKNSGPLYGHGQILAEGIADASDSLAAVKKFVYEDKRYTMAELVDALKRDFDGYDEMYHTLKNTHLKFGNDIDYVDEIAVGLVDHFNKYLQKIPTHRGGFFGGGCSPFNRAATWGMHTAALPSGKKHGEPMFADSIGAVPGNDTNGPTALLKSCLKFDHKLATSGFILNIKFDKTLFNTKTGKEAFMSVYKTYFTQGAQQLSVTVVSAEELREAQIDPDNHRDLIVRVGGYSDYFVDLSKELQDNVIARTDYGA